MMEFREVVEHFIGNKIPDNSKIVFMSDNITETTEVGWRDKVVHKSITIEWEELEDKE